MGEYVTVGRLLSSAAFIGSYFFKNAVVEAITVRFQKNGVTIHFAHEAIRFFWPCIG